MRCAKARRKFSGMTVAPSRVVPALLLGLGLLLSAQTPAEPSIIPRPASMTVGAGAFTLTKQTTIVVSDRVDTLAARRLARDLAPATGFDLPVRVGTATSGSRIVFTKAAAHDTSL